MKIMRYWSVRHARGLHWLYQGLETLLVFLHPVLDRVGYERLETPFSRLESAVKGFLFDSQSCGQCTLGNTGMACPMNCPKSLRNGPCGGVRADGGCEIEPEMTCVWVTAWEGSQKLGNQESTIQIIQPPLDVRNKGTSAWLRATRKKVADNHAV